MKCLEVKCRAAARPKQLQKQKLPSKVKRVYSIILRHSEMGSNVISEKSLLHLKDKPPFCLQSSRLASPFSSSSKLFAIQPYKSLSQITISFSYTHGSGRRPLVYLFRFFRAKRPQVREVTLCTKGVTVGTAYLVKVIHCAQHLPVKNKKQTWYAYAMHATYG